LLLVAATVLSYSVMANEAPPGFDPASVPERLRVLEGRTAYIKIPPQDEAPLYAAQGAVLGEAVVVQEDLHLKRTTSYRFCVAGALGG
jgi:hypothetical protein